MRHLHAVQACSRAGAAWNAGDGGVLPGSMEVQVWQQVVHAMSMNVMFLFLFLYIGTKVSLFLTMVSLVSAHQVSSTPFVLVKKINHCGSSFVFICMVVLGT